MFRSATSRRTQALLATMVCLICLHTRAGAQRGNATGAAQALVLTPDGLAVIGGKDRAWIAKRTLAGNEELFRVYLGSDARDAVNALATGSDGKLYAAGTLFVSGVERGFLAALDKDGNRVSFTALPSAAYALAIDDEDGLYVAGDSYIQLPRGRSIVPPGPVGALGVDEDGHVYAAGRKAAAAETDSYGNDAYVARLAETQDRWDWVLSLGGTGAVEEARALAFDSDGAIYVAGVTNSVDFPVRNPFQSKLNGLQDGFIVKVLPDGTGVEWSTYLGGHGADSVAAMVVDANQELVLTGSKS